ncbi:hypothetical protein [Nocardioides coralli]|uniref:hypothetical protein n=1 Tax=Nocardioides coralli TaxID=2872154 RepID=UPI001CA3BD0E|nr:hypothetical protein [Nocardioides coralli]QZY28931.1 hypothetical protein K6T13_16060 [Nocardioides coralli]
MRRVAAVLAAALLLAGCSGSDSSTLPGYDLGRQPSAEPTTAPPSDTPSPTASGEPDAPAVLDWQPVEGDPTAETTVSGRWRLSLTEGGEATLTGPREVALDVPRDFRVTDALLDTDHAVVVAEHERAEQPNVATVVDLASGRTSTIDGDSEVPTTVGGTWALGSGLLVHATTQGRDYCLAVADLVTGRSRLGPCVPPRHGITNAHVSPAGITAMTFDDGRPSCRTLNRVEGDDFVPLAGVQECRGWEAVATETFAAWGVVPRERRIEDSVYLVDTGEGPVEIGPGTTGSLTWCGSAAYVVRDPQRAGDPARLLRVAPDGGTEVVYESPGRGKAFLSAPRCGGSHLTISAFSAAGDEQVTAALD